MSPLRWKIAAGYLVAIVITIYLWKDLEHGWSALMTFLAPLFTFLTALVALEFGVVITAIGVFLVVFLQGFIGLIVAVAKIGVIKGLFLPWVLGVLQWLHDKSEWLQHWVKKIFDKFRHLAEKVYRWWRARNLIDRILLLGFIGPLVLVVTFALLIKRFVYMFISKKAAEQLVQRATKASIKHFHKVPLLGKVPTQVKQHVAKLKQSRDRKLAQLRGDSADNQS